MNVNEAIWRLSPAERKKVENRAADIITEEMILRDPRKARKLTRAAPLTPPCPASKSAAIY